MRATVWCYGVRNALTAREYMLQGARCRSTSHIHARTALFLVVQQVRSQSYSKTFVLGVRIIAILARQSVEYDRLERWIYAYVVEVHTSWNDTFWARQSVLCLQLFALLTYHHTSSAG